MKNNCVAWKAFSKDGSVATYLLYKACSQKNGCDGKSGYSNQTEYKGLGNTSDQRG